jgi:DNA end-binding protein Ku
LPAPTEKPIAAPTNVVNLMDALRRSIAIEGKAPAPKKGKKRIEGQGEMLLPIAGKKGKEDPNKAPVKPATRRKAG